MLKTILRRAKAIPGIMIFFLVMCGIASAQSDGPSTKELGDSINILWMLFAGFLVFFMQAGFALVETGFTRARECLPHHDDEYDGVLHRSHRLLACGFCFSIRRREFHSPRR